MKTQPDNGGNTERDPSFRSPYPVTRLSPSFELVDLAKEIAQADDMLSIQTSGKLQLLAKQIRTLQEEARKLLEETTRNQQLHKAACSFKKKVGKTYHLYRRDDNTLVFSMIAPEEWGSSVPHDYAGSFRLENDMSWTEVKSKDNE